MKRIYHNYELWEDFKNGMYEEPLKSKLEGETSEVRIEKAVKLLTDELLCQHYMERVAMEWVYACEQVFTNSSMNRIAWLGQAACCLYAGIKESETRKAWWHLTEKQQETANSIAASVIKEWEKRNEEKIRD